MPSIEIPNIEIIPNWTQLILQLVSLCFLFFVFKRFAWIPTKAFLSERQAFLNVGFQEAEDAKKEGQQFKEEYEARLSQVEIEAEEIIEASRAQGRLHYDEMIADARGEVSDKLAKVALAIEDDKLVAQAKLKEEILDLVASGAEAVIKKEIDAKTHEQLFADFIAKVGDEDE